MIIVIENNLNSACDAMAAAAHVAGHTVIHWWDGDPVPAAADVFLGSLEQCGSGSMPGVLGDPNNLRVKHWLPLVKDLALNVENIETTVGRLPYSLPWGDTTFIRPDSCLKPFSGRLIHQKDLVPKALDFGYYYNDLNLPVLLSEPRDITAEWRFVAVNRKIVTTTHYSHGVLGPFQRHIPIPDEAHALAQEAAARSPEPTVVIDLCQLRSGAVKLLEYNLFSGADLYDCDMEAILQALAG